MGELIRAVATSHQSKTEAKPTFQQLEEAQATMLRLELRKLAQEVDGAQIETDPPQTEEKHEQVPAHMRSTLDQLTELEASTKQILHNEGLEIHLQRQLGTLEQMTNQAQTQVHTLCGTGAQALPEQCTLDSVWTRSNIYKPPRRVEQMRTELNALKAIVMGLQLKDHHSRHTSTGLPVVSNENMDVDVD